MKKTKIALAIASVLGASNSSALDRFTKIDANGIAMPM
jgi:hypothetical protein